MLSLAITKFAAKRSVILTAATRPIPKCVPDVISRSKHWVPTEARDIQKLTESAMIHDISLHQMETVRKVVPWFLTTMPISYFNQISEEMRRSHLQAVAAIHDLRLSDLSLKIINKSDHGVIEVTIFNTHTISGSFLTQLAHINQTELPNHELAKIKVFSSEDSQFALNIFTFIPRSHHIPSATIADGADHFSAVEDIRSGKNNDPLTPPYNEKLHNRAAMEEYIQRCPPQYVKNSHPRRFLIQRGLYDQVKGSDDSAVHIEPYMGSGGPPSGTAAWVTIAVGNSFPDELLRLTADMIAMCGLDIWRANLDKVYDPNNSIPASQDTPYRPGYVTLLRLLVSPDPSVFTSPDALFGPDFVPRITRDLKRCKWLDDMTLRLAFPNDTAKTAFGVSKAEVVTAMSSMLHGPLSAQYPVAFSSVQSIVDTLTSSPYISELTEAVAQLFLDKFNPAVSEKGRTQHFDQINERADALKGKISRLQREESRVALQKFMEAIELTLKTNFYNDDRYAMSMRIKPRLMFTAEELEGPNPKAMPFGLFFSHGRYFNGFHNRFSDISSGELRIVTPPNSDTKAIESTRQFDEVYFGSLEQQFKNKDTPAGGAEALILVDSPSVPVKHHEFLKHKCVKAFVDSILDLTVRDDKFRRVVVDLYGKDEVIFLGTDCRHRLDSIVARAAVRGYDYPAAIMFSSGMSAGFNQKEYGTTSEGVVVFLDVALRESLGIDPTSQPFTVKITGGTEDDIAGNIIKILFREYGNNTKVVGICDACGVVEDPNGLDEAELLRLVKQGKPIEHFDSKKLSPEGVIFQGGESEEGIARRNSMPFRVKADVFIPASGRPLTVNTTNWKNFLDKDGIPTSKLIVEGSQFFNSAGACQIMFEEAGIVIIKESIATKCSVIASSCEISCSMLLSREEFIRYKPELVKDVLAYSCKIAEVEAKLMFNTYKRFPGSLTQFSERISACINRVSDSLIDVLADKGLGDPLLEELLPLAREVLPKKLAEIAWDRARDRMPLAYLKSAVAAALGSKMVYQEGIHLVESHPNAKLAERAIQYYRADQRVARLVEALGNGTATAEERAHAMLFLRKGGARASLGIF